jgi:hypothetical protein
MIMLACVALGTHVFLEYQNEVTRLDLEREDHALAFFNACGPHVVRAKASNCDALQIKAQARPRMEALSNTAYHVFFHDLNPVNLVGCGPGSYCRSKLSMIVDVSTAGAVFAIPVAAFFALSVCALMLYRFFNPPVVQAVRDMREEERRSIGWSRGRHHAILDSDYAFDPEVRRRRTGSPSVYLVNESTV